MAQTSVAVIGAGVFGGCTALNLLKRGAKVTLIDTWGPGHSRASSGGESRVIHATYGPREIYTAWVVRSLELWKQYDAQWGTHGRALGEHVAAAVLGAGESDPYFRWARF